MRSAPRQLDRTVTAQALPTETLLNAVMLVPLGVALALAARRLLPAVAVLLVVPGAVEVVQTRIPGRTCSGVDYLTNLGGGLAGVALGAVLLVVTRRPRTDSR